MFSNDEKCYYVLCSYDNNDVRNLSSFRKFYSPIFGIFSFYMFLGGGFKAWGGSFGGRFLQNGRFFARANAK